MDTADRKARPDTCLPDKAKRPVKRIMAYICLVAALLALEASLMSLFIRDGAWEYAVASNGAVVAAVTIFKIGMHCVHQGKDHFQKTEAAVITGAAMSLPLIALLIMVDRCL